MDLKLAVVAVAAAVTAAAAADCPADYTFHPLVLLSLDGFRADYLDRGLTPTLQALADDGIHVPFIKASYPTQTFPNHYTIITGLYPEHHGIVANEFYDPEFHAKFEVGSAESQKSRWWGGEPLWNTVTRQGKLSATYFWPGSDVDIGGQRPTYWFPYNYTVPYEDRIDQVLDWLSLPVEERPTFIASYFNEPDHTGHEFGPETPELDDQLVMVDLLLDRLVTGLVARGLESCVNLIVVADHGMANSVGIPDVVIKLADYIPNIFDLAYVNSGAFGRIDPKNESEAAEIYIMEQLACQRDEMRIYQKEVLPTRLYYGNNRRIADLIVDLDPGYMVSVSYDLDNLGNHGYDFYAGSMNALFVASGPDLKKRVEVESFQNIELYNLMCHLTGVEPAPNNGTLGSLYHILADPPQLPTLPQEEKPPTAQYPAGDVGLLLGMSGCSGDLSTPEAWLESLTLNEAQQNASEKYHLPWGVPHSGSLPADLTLLHHLDHVTGYSNTIKMPLWTSVTLEGPPAGTGEADWSSDVRLQPDTSPTCDSYNQQTSLNVTMYPLFPPQFSANSSLERVPYLVSNAVPVSPYLSGHWSYLLDTLVTAWLTSYAPLNLVMGPVFDNNADSYPDNFANFSTPEVPSDLFAVITRCLTPVTSLDLCPFSDLDATSYIFPEYQPVSNCLDEARYAKEFSAKVHDVESATGLTLYPEVDTYNRTAVVLRIHSDIWPPTP